MKTLIDKIIEYSVTNRFLVILLTLGITLWGVYCLYRTPVDAIPDLSENQVIVWADWMGRSPKEIEDQVTYPLSVNLQGLAGVKSIRATSEFGFSMINIIFDDSIDFYFARQRVLERLSIAGSFLPAGVVPYLAPDATALGQIFWYTVEGEGKSLDELRSIQDWYVRYQLNSVPGVAQVASVGGFVREYQIDVDPEKMRAFDVSLGQVFRAVMASNSSVGGKVIHKGGAEYLVRGYGWLRGVDDLRKVVLTERRGVPIRVEDVGTVQLGPAFRRSVLEKGGREAVGGVVMMRYGENPLEITERIKAKIQQLQSGLPAGIRIVPFYDRTGLIEASIGTLKGALTEAILTASIVVFLVLWHLRSSIVICVTLPLAVLVSFIFMYYLNIPSNIMSLAGIAISIGVLVDAGCVMTENAYNRLHEHFGSERVRGDTRHIVIDACKVVGQPIFFSILIMLLSFAPVFVLGGLEGKMFNPLAYTKTFALVGVGVLSITLLPAIIPVFVRGKLKSQEEVWLVRSFVNIYKPMLQFFLKYPDVIVVITGLFLLCGLPLFPRKVPWIFFIVGVPFIVAANVMLAARWKMLCFGLLLVVALVSFREFKPLGEEFMPPLDELSIMDMPITTPNANITQAGDDIKERNMLMRQFPEVHQVVGKVGRAETPTDPAPVDMVETVVSLRPRDWWPKRKINYEEMLSEAREVVRALLSRGVLKDISENDLGDFSNTVTMDAATRFDRAMRELSTLRLREYIPEKGAELIRLLRTEIVSFLKAKGALTKEVPETRWIAFDDGLARKYAANFDEWILLEEVTRAAQEVVEFLLRERAVPSQADLFVEPPVLRSEILESWLDGRPPEKGADLVRRFRSELVALLKEKGALARELAEADWAPQDAELAAEFSGWSAESVRPEDLARAGRRIVDFLVARGAAGPRADLLVEPQTLFSKALDPLRAIAGREKSTLFQKLKGRLEARAHDLMAARVRRLNWEIADRAPAAMVWFLIEESISKAREQGKLAREPKPEELHALRDERAKAFGNGLFLWQKLKSDLVKEMDSELQVPGWGNIWTQPIINRVDMLATGVRTMIGVKVFGDNLETIQKVSEEIAVVLKQIRGAVDVFPDQIVGENYLEISIDRDKAARYGVNVEDVQDVIEVALGGKEITMTVEGRQRFPVRVRYPRDWREDEERVKSILVPAAGAMQAKANGQMGMDAGSGNRGPASAGAASGRLRQIPLSFVADVRIVPGPSMIKSENGLLRSYVQLNVRDRDIVGFVEEAQRAVDAKVKLPPGYYIEWSGQFEHQMRAQKTLTVVFPMVVLIIFVILYMTYKDFSDTLMMFLAVPGAVAGGALFQYLWGYNFSVAVWVGYILCFGLATETGIVMLVYLREAIDKRGGMERIRSEAEIKEAVIEGAVHRLRPKLLTEGTTILALIPMLWATGVGAEYIRPMAAPVLGGILVADEVIDVFIPVLFYWDRCRRLKNRKAREAAEAPAAASDL